MVKGNMISKQVHIKTETMEIGNIPWGKIIEKHTRYWVSITSCRYSSEITYLVQSE